jgi:mannonate dehydratase
MLTRDNLRFARQMGAEAIVVHMADYASGMETHSHFDGDAAGRDVSQLRGVLWTEEELIALREKVEAEGLELAALENLNPAHWHDVLLGGPEADQQLADVLEIIRRIGRAGIPCLGYNFSLAGVHGRRPGAYARGGAASVAFTETEDAVSTPLSGGWVSNRVYAPDMATESIEAPTSEELWQRLFSFLEAALPIAEEYGVKLAVHPDDPPLPMLRGTPRLIHRPEHFQRVLDHVQSPSNKLEFCIGTIAEMPDVDVEEVVERFSVQRAIGYVHFRNVRGQLPEYSEVFVDEGDVDMFEVLRILHKNGYEGVLIPDHTPFPSCEAPWHAGMGFALGYMRAALQSLEQRN